MAASAVQRGPNHPRAGHIPIPGRDPAVPELGGQTEPAPGVGSRGTIKQQTESHCEDDPCQRVWSQPGVPSKGPRSCRKFSQTFLRREKYLQHGKFLQKAALFWIKNEVIFIS